MRLNRLDMNLIIALEAILRLRSVTTAAEELHLTQPALSQALRRLRDYFDDPIVTMVGRRLQPTEFGLQLLPAASRLLHETRHLSRMRPGFDPAITQRRFSVVASDYVTRVLFTPMLRRLSQEAPGISLQMGPIDAQSDSGFQRGEVDFVIVPERFLFAEHPSHGLFKDDFVCVISEDHPTIGTSLTVETYLAHRHVVTGFGGSWRGSHFEEWIAENAIELDVAMSVPSFSLLPECIKGTPYIATVHRRLWASLPPSMGLRTLPHPLHVPGISENLQWHASREFDSSVAWFRDFLIEAAQTTLTGVDPA